MPNKIQDNGAQPPILPATVPRPDRMPRLKDPNLYINRELSWLEFNARVLDEARNTKVPLFERLKFLAIFSTNLDEFFMVRIAGLQTQQHEGIVDIPPDGATPEEQLQACSERAHELIAAHCRAWNEEVAPALAEVGIALVSPEQLSPEEQAKLDQHFDKNIFPVLTPIAIDPSHPFPHVRNHGINVGVLFEKPNGGESTEPDFGVVQVPMMLPRLLQVPHPSYRRAFVTLEDLIFRRLSSIFPQANVSRWFAFRVTRNFDITIDDDEAEDLLLTMQSELRKRERGEAVRLEVSGNAPEESIAYLCSCLNLDSERDTYLVDAPLHIPDLGQLTKGDDRREHRDEPHSPQYVRPLRDAEDFFDSIRERDILLHHPYESFEAVVDFVSLAAEDPQVLAIKQTLYRSGGGVSARQCPAARRRGRQAGHSAGRAESPL